MTFTVYEKAFDVLPPSWIIVSLELIGLNKKNPSLGRPRETGNPICFYM
jgi:hypothetical protein